MLMRRLFLVTLLTTGFVASVQAAAVCPSPTSTPQWKPASCSEPSQWLKIVLPRISACASKNLFSHASNYGGFQFVGAVYNGEELSCYYKARNQGDATSFGVKAEKYFNPHLASTLSGPGWHPLSSGSYWCTSNNIAACGSDD